MASLEIHDNGTRKVYQILDSEFFVGVDRSCEVALSSEGVAPRHARIYETADGTHCVEAAGAEVEVDDAQVDSCELEHGAILRIGSAVLVYAVDGEPRPIVPRRVIEGQHVIEGQRVTEGERAGPAAAAGSGSAAQPKERSAPIVPKPIPPTARPAVVRKPRGGIAVKPIQAAPGRDREGQPSLAERRRRMSESSSSRAGPVPRWMMASLALLGGAAVIFVIVRGLGAVSDRDPRKLLSLAEVKLRDGQIPLARSYVDQAEQNDHDRVLRDEIRRLRAKLDDVAQAKSDLLAVGMAREELDRRLLRFHRFYLVKKPSRSAAREFLPMLDAWLAEHREVCSRSPEPRRMVDQVEGWRRQYADLAAMETPDTADDLLFRAGMRVGGSKRRNYREALAMLDQWLAANSGAADAKRVREKRDAWVKDSERWFRQTLRQLDRLANDGGVEEAIERLRFLAEEASLPGWDAKLQEKLAAFESRR